MRRRHALAAGLALLPAVARGYTDRPITLVTGYAPGGSTDVAARILADRMAARIGPEVRIMVDNRPGAAGVVATDWLKRQPADGSVIMVTETGASAAAPAAIAGFNRYDPVGDFTQLGVISTPPAILVVNRNFPGRTGPEVLREMRRAAPDSLIYASSGVGGVLHLRGELLAWKLGTRFEHVPYRSGALMMQAVLTDDAQFGIAALASATPFVRDGLVRGIAMAGTRRFPTFPDIPTFAELGIDGMEDGGFFLLVAPAGLPVETARTLNAALVETLAEPATRERLIQAGHLPPEGPNTPATARAYLVQQVAAYRALVERTGIRLTP
jgi:tripartite-type tricarboxylate transporter receptor subunit TctC